MLGACGAARILRPGQPAEATPRRDVAAETGPEPGDHGEPRRPQLRAGQLCGRLDTGGQVHGAHTVARAAAQLRKRRGEHPRPRRRRRTGSARHVGGDERRGPAARRTTTRMPRPRTGWTVRDRSPACTTLLSSPVHVSAGRTSRSTSRPSGRRFPRSRRGTNAVSRSRTTTACCATYPGALGGKGGFTDIARHNFVGAAQRDGRRLVVALLGAEHSPLRTWQQAAALLNWGFSLPSDTSVGRLVNPGEAEHRWPSRPAEARPRPRPGAPPPPRVRGGCRRGPSSPSGIVLFAGLFATAWLAVACPRAGVGPAETGGLTVR